jgi:uncharacterized linocin/CFP29 family protein
MSKANIQGVITQAGNSFQANGSIAQTLLNNNGNISSLRTNATLQDREWEHIDKEILRSYRDELVGVRHLKERNLVYDLNGKGMSFTVMKSQSMGQAGNAHLTMTGLSHGESTLPEFSINYFPLPILASDWFLDFRHLQESRNAGTNLDTTMQEESAAEVAQLQEEILFNGAELFEFGGGTLYGYTDFPNRHQGTLNAAWDDDDVTGKNIVEDVRNMLDDVTQDKQRGPFGIYIPVNYEAVLGMDYSDNHSNKTIRQRIMEISSKIEFIEVSDKLADGSVVMVQLKRDTVRMVTGQALTNVQWQEQGGFALKFKILTIDIPQIRADHDDHCGLVHYSAPSETS